VRAERFFAKNLVLTLLVKCVSVRVRSSLIKSPSPILVRTILWFYCQC